MCKDFPFSCRQWPRHAVLSCENPCNSGSLRSCLENRRGSLCQFNHGVLLRPCIPRAKSRLHWRAPVCHDWGSWGCLPSHDEKQLEEHRTERPDPRRRCNSQQWPCPYLYGRTLYWHAGVSIWIKSKMSNRSQNRNAASSWSWCHL